MPDFGLVHGTPVEAHAGFAVKREDLCCPPPGPSFSKYRGVVGHLERRLREGAIPGRKVGVLDTAHSKAGWGVTYAARFLGLRSVVFYPEYKADPRARESQLRAHELGAELRALPAGRSAVLYHAARREAEAEGAYMMPNALKLEESVEETAAELARSAPPPGEEWTDVVVSVSSGTIAAGVLLGLAREAIWPTVWLHLGYSRSREAVLRYVEGWLRFPARYLGAIRVIDEGYAYRDRARSGPEAPFPCNPYYDLKAWGWAVRARARGLLGERPLFWNVGA